jgi:preprotein translocase subunit YajC
MDILIPNAYAQAGGGGAGMGDLLFIVILFGVFYFLLIRPQQKRAKEHKNMVEAISKGDEIVTQGGVLGRIRDVGDAFLTVEIGEGIEIRVQRGAVGALMPKGTIKDNTKASAKSRDAKRGNASARGQGSSDNQSDTSSSGSDEPSSSGSDSNS